jgi:hypothetical protein
MSAVNPDISPISFEAGLNDRAGSGLAITVAAAATPEVVLGSAFAERSNNSGGGLVWDAAAGTLTVALKQAEGRYDLEAVAGDIIGTNAAVLDLGIFKDPAGSDPAAVVGNESRKTELASAARNGIAPAVARGVSLEVGDVVSLRLRVGTNGHAGTFRQLSLAARKVASL